MNILITGITGFVGSNLVGFLKQRNPNSCIYGLDIIQPPKEGVERIYSWEDMLTIPDVDVVVHLAGKAHDVKKQAVASCYFDVNLGLTQCVYEWSKTRRVRKFIFFSSIKAAVDESDGRLITEDRELCPKGPYGESKMAAERYLLENEQKGMTCFVLRPCMIHGPGNKGNLNLLYHVIRKGIPWPLGIYENRRSFCSVENICYVVHELVGKEIAGGIYNVGDDCSVSTNELIRLIADSLGQKILIWRFPRTIVERLAKLGGGLHLPLNSERLRKLTETYEVSNQKIKQVLGIEKMPVDAIDGLKRTLESFRRR